MKVNARSQDPKGWHRALTASAVLLSILAAGMAVMAFTIFSPAAGVVLDPEPATLAPGESVPTTEPPVPEPAAAVPELGATSTTVAPEVVSITTTLPPRIPPAQLVINDIEVNGHVRAVGLDDSGAMEVPDVTEIGWYLHGAVPGHAGATVLVAHVWWDDTAGPFHRLGALDPGASIEVRLGDGAVHGYTVVERAMYDKYALPSHLWRNSGPETLVLITCGGEFNRGTNRFNQNIVVLALPTGIAPFIELSTGEPVS